MDDAEVGKVHWKIMFISGMGFLPNGIPHRSMSGWSRQQHCRQRRPGRCFSVGLRTCSEGSIYGYECLVLAADEAR
jgi:hypothetical protein